MAETTTDYTKLDYVADVKRYVPNPNVNALNAIKRYVGIALQKKDSALVACSDAGERKRIVENFMKKKLALTADDATLDKSVQEICQQMKADKEKLRVTFCYLLADKLGKLGNLT